ncbi:NAD(P)H-dependent oxidoreductase [uncultured Parasphingorhabdus sp.]|uniref:FMN-dependent NADH-azoreductase n=1 Tax=uncultured Parasphingorhabdus sp. TaxID=2709694 RepID=UPI002AA8249E|nr:NAD(P)H-dependent oxidoreductase [uncultured Parasphingorhabdus sp.]
MTKLLFIEASPRKENSYSSQVANEFLESYKAANPEDEIERLPLFETELAPLGMEGANQKMENIMKLMTTGSGIEPEGEWAGVMKEIERLKSADKVLLSAPMWNYSIPYRLKHWIDLVVQVGASVMVNEKFEYIGQITDRPLQMILASGSPYENRFPLESDGTKTDFERAYLDHIFRFLGFTDIRLIRVMPTGMPGPQLDEIVANAKKEAKEAAKAF